MTANIEWTVLPHTMTTHLDLHGHPSVLLNGLNKLRCCDKLLDVTLIVEGEAFKAHRVVLASCSEYFRAMFTDAMREAGQSEICLKGVTAHGIGLLINYVYTSELDLNLANVQDVLSSASHCQIDAVIGACSSYLETQIDLDNCVDIATIAETYSLEKLKQKAYRFICSRLSDFSRTLEINSLTWQQFEIILRCDYPVDCSEATVLQIVLDWIISQKADTKIARKLLQQVRFMTIPPDDLGHTLRSIFNVSITYYATLRSTVSEQMFTVPKFCPSSDKVLINARGMEMALVKIGGFGINGITNKITYYLPSRKKWHNLTVIPHVEQCNYGTAVLDNELFVVGGCYDVCLKEYIHPFGFRYCPTKNKWSTIKPMQQDRCRFSLNAMGQYLFAVCGASEITENDEVLAQDSRISNCERYNSRTDSWEYIPSLIENRTQHSGTTHSHHLYISGGLDRYRVLSSFWRYDTFNEKWEELPSMRTPRADHVSLVIKDKLYICGGWYEESPIDNRRLVETIDVYDISSNTWSVETTIPKPKYHTGIVAVNSKIYVIGGLHPDALFDRSSSAIECYDIPTKKWKRLDRYPQHIWECTCVTLYVPRCREDMEVIVSNGNKI